jgi:DNA-binding IclR family transcriptional regulator
MRGESVPNKPETQLIQSVDRALTLMEIVAAQKDEISLQALSYKAGLNSSTAYRLLNTLRAHGLVQQSPDTRGYRLGLKILQLATAVRDQLDLQQLVRPFLQYLAEASGESANLVVLEGDEAVYIDQVLSTHPIRAFTQIGVRVPLHCAAVGKMLLAHMPDQRREDIIRKGLPAFTKNTITNPYRLREELAKVRDQGFAVDIEERQEQVRCVAAGVLDDQSSIVAAISISGPAHRLSSERLQDELSGLVRKTAGEISSNLGCPSSLP